MITLTIIGVIAALTIPNLIAKYEKEQTVVAVKKAYNQLNQAVTMARTEYGELDTWDYNLSTEEYFNKYLKPYLKLAKYCGVSNNTECYTNTIKNLNNVSFEEYPAWSQYLKVTLADGSSLLCFMRNYLASSKALQIYVDIDGKKGSNKLGKDIFSFYIVNKFNNYPTSHFLNFGNGDVIQVNKSITSGFFPDGYGYNREQLIAYKYRCCSKNNCNYYAKGNFCAALIMKDGWQIKDDYPW